MSHVACKLQTNNSICRVMLGMKMMGLSSLLQLLSAVFVGLFMLQYFHKYESTKPEHALSYTRILLSGPFVLW